MGVTHNTCNVRLAQDCGNETDENERQNRCTYCLAYSSCLTYVCTGVVAAPPGNSRHAQRLPPTLVNCTLSPSSPCRRCIFGIRVSGSQRLGKNTRPHTHTHGCAHRHTPLLVPSVTVAQGPPCRVAPAPSVRNQEGALPFPFCTLRMRDSTITSPQDNPGTPDFCADVGRAC